MSHVAWSVCLSVCVCDGHKGELCKDGWTDPDAVWRADLCGPKEPCIRWGDWGRDPPTERDNFRGLSGPPKSMGSLCCGVCSKKDNPILNNAITTRLLQPTAMLPPRPTGVTLLVPVKNPPSAMRPFAKILWPLYIYTIIRFHAVHYSHQLLGAA